MDMGDLFGWFYLKLKPQYLLKKIIYSTLNIHNLMIKQWNKYHHIFKWYFIIRFITKWKFFIYFLYQYKFYTNLIKKKKTCNFVKTKRLLWDQIQLISILLTKDQLLFKPFINVELKPSINLNY